MTIAEQIKTDPVQFMMNNILMMSAELNGLSMNGGVQPFQIVKSSMKGYKDGAEINVYSMKKMGSGGDQLNAYWCPYEQNKTGTAMLSGQFGPSIMFTAAMDGCTFGAGSRAADGSVRVAHVNMAEQAKWGGSANQRRLQGNIARGFLGKGAGTSMQDPDRYYTKALPPGGLKIATTTFGIRTGDGAGRRWIFYTHSWYSSSVVEIRPDNHGVMNEIKSHRLNWLCCDPILVSL